MSLYLGITTIRAVVGFEPLRSRKKPHLDEAKRSVSQVVLGMAHSLACRHVPLRKVTVSIDIDVLARVCVCVCVCVCVLHSKKYARPRSVGLNSEILDIEKKGDLNEQRVEHYDLRPVASLAKIQSVILSNSYFRVHAMETFYNSRFTATF